MDDVTLAALLKDGTPAQDWRFTLSVMRRIEQRRFRHSLLRNVVLGLTAILALACAAPALGLIMRDLAVPLSNNLIIAALMLAGAVLALPWLALRD